MEKTQKRRRTYERSLCQRTQPNTKPVRSQKYAISRRGRKKERCGRKRKAVKKYDNLSKGSNFRTVKEGEYKGKPIHFTSQNFENVNEGDEIIFDLINDRLQVSETLEEREAKDTNRKAKLAEEKALIAKEERLFALASKHGVKLSLS